MSDEQSGAGRPEDQPPAWWTRPEDQQREPVPPGWAPRQPPAHGPAYGAEPGSGWTPPQPPPQPTGAPGAPGWQQQGWQQQGWQQQPGWQPPPPGGGPGQPGWGGGYPGYPPPPPLPPRPGIIPLRPLGVGEILDGAITAMRRHWRTMIGLSAVLAAVTQLVSLPFKWLLLHDVVDTSTAAQADPEQDLSFLGGAITSTGIELLLTVFAIVVLTGILTAAVSRAVLGQPVTTREAWDRARPRVPALLGVLGVVVLIALAVTVVCLLPGILLLAAGQTAAGAVLLVLGVPAFLVIGVYLYVALALAPPAVVLERQGVRGALSRSRALVKGSWWRTFGILLLVNVIAQVLSGILATPLQLLALGVAYVSGDDMNVYAFWPLVVTSAGTIVASAITWPFTAVATALLYVDRRMRREALDLELVRAAGAPGPIPTADQPQPRP